MTSSRRGFSLLEVLVSIAVLIMVIVSVLTLMQRGISATILSRDRLVAAYLAQDAVEYIRARIHDNYIASTGTEDWIRGFKNCEPPPSTQRCFLDTTTDPPPLPSSKGYAETCGAGCPPLSFHAPTKRYGYGSGIGWTKTKFTRHVDMKILNHPEATGAPVRAKGIESVEVRVIVEIKWRGVSGDQSFIVRTNVFNIGPLF